MRNFLLITKVQLGEIFNFKNAFNSKNKAKTTSFLLITILVIAFFFFLSFIYNFTFGFLLDTEDKIELLQPLMFFIATFLTFLTTIFKVKGVIFGSKDFEILQSLPIKSGTIVASKLFVLYLYEVLFTIVVMLPCNIVYAIFVNSFIPLLIPSLLFSLLIPIVPLVVASLIGFIIAIISEKIRFKNVIQIILYILMFVAIFSFSFISSNSAEVTSAFSGIINTMDKYYPLANIYLRGCVNFEVLYTLLFIIINLVAAALYIIIIGKGYKKINLMVLSKRAHNKYVSTYLKNNGQLKTLFMKEIRKYFQTPLYMINTIIGGIMLIVLGVFAVIYKYEINSVIIEYKIYFEIFAPFISCYLLGMATTTSVSISLEGSNFWIIKSSPIDYKKYYLSKILVNVLVLGLCGLISNILIGIAINASLLCWIFLIIIPVLTSILTGVFGLLINLMYPKIKWTTEQAAIKNSASTILCMLGDMFISVLVGLIVGFFVVLYSLNGTNPYIGVLLATLFMILLTYILIKILYSKGEKLINKIEV